MFKTLRKIIILKLKIISFEHKMAAFEHNCSKNVKIKLSTPLTI